MNQVRWIEIASELGAGTRGASLGIQALKVAAFNKEMDLFKDTDTYVQRTYNDRLWQEEESPFAKRISGVKQVFEDTVFSVSQTLSNGDFPLVLSGDHSTAGATIAGIKTAFPDKRLGVIWVDAHADLHTPYTTPSGNIHGMPLATALGTDNLAHKRNDVPEDIATLWNDLKGMGGSKLNPEDLIFVAVRDTEKEEDALMEEHMILNITVNTVRSKGAKDIASQIRGRLSNCDMIYVSFDVDSMDCDTVSMGTGTPVKEGLFPDEARDLLCELVRDEKVVCFEMVEINPCLDNKCNTMAETAVDILEEVHNVIKDKSNVGTF